MSSLNLMQKTAIAVLTLVVAACAQTGRVDVAAITSAEIFALSAQDNMVFASGQPTQEQLGILADSGVQHIISLRTEGELEWDESQVVASAGMVFHSLPVSGRDGVTTANAESLEQLLARLDGQPVLVHCGSSNRVGALRAVTARDAGASIDAALAEGRQWGLTQMEDRVRTTLEAN